MPQGWFRAFLWNVDVQRQHLSPFFTFSSGSGVCAELRPVVPVFALHEEWRSVIAVCSLQIFKMFVTTLVSMCRNQARVCTLKTSRKRPGHFPRHWITGNCYLCGHLALFFSQSGNTNSWLQDTLYQNQVSTNASPLLLLCQLNT